MKTRIKIKSLSVLIGILFSLSLNAFNSLQQFYHCGAFSPNKVHVDIPAGNDCSNNILSEELEIENDNEEFLSEAFFILPFCGLSMDCYSSIISCHVQDSPIEISRPIYLAVRTIRI